MVIEDKDDDNGSYESDGGKDGDDDGGYDGDNVTTHPSLHTKKLQSFH